jgi:hypothetical protein
MQTDVSGRYIDFPANRVKNLVRTTNKWLENEDWNFPQPFDFRASVNTDELRERFSEAIAFWDVLATENGGNCTKTLGEIFDREFSVILHSVLEIDRRTAASAEFWHAIAFRVLPEISYWRWARTLEGVQANIDDGPNSSFSKKAVNRYLVSNGPRSIYSRLWWRAELFGHAALKIRGDLPDQFLERPLSIALNRNLSQSALWCLLTNKNIAVNARVSDELAAACASSAVYKSVNSTMVTALLSELGREAFTQEIGIFTLDETKEWVTSIANRLGLSHRRPDWDELYG